MENVSHNTSFDEDEGDLLSDDIQRDLLTNEQDGQDEQDDQDHEYYNEGESPQIIKGNQQQFNLTSELGKVPYELQ